jgi:lysophospholipase L1-like esterase
VNARTFWDLWLKRLASAAVIGAVTLALYCVVDWGYGRLFPVKPYAAHLERLTLTAYKGEAYFSEAFLEESFTQPGGWETPPGTRIVVPRPYDGKFFHVDVLEPTGLPYRRTINPAGADGEERLVLLLGGSTVYNSEVPDELTVASQLSVLLNRAGGPRYRVLNAGVSSVNTTQERERLEIELARGLRPWAVISLNGINDVNQGVYFGNPEGVMFSGQQRSQVKEWLKATLPLNIYRSVRVRAELENARTVPAHLLDSARIEALAFETANVYRRNVAAMNATAQRHGAFFWSVLQPHLFSSQYRTRTTDIQEVEQLAERTLPQTRAAFDSGYRALRGAAKELRAEGVRASDTSDLFFDKTADIFLDVAHVNSIGNRRLAEHLAGLILSGPPVPEQR